MSLKTKITSIMAATIVGFAGLLFGLEMYQVFKSFNKLQEEAVETDYRRAKQAIVHEFNSVRVLAADWGYWDNLYSFVQGQNSGFVVSNICPSTFTETGLDYIGIYNIDGKLIHSSASSNNVMEGIEEDGVFGGDLYRSTLVTPDNSELEVIGLGNTRIGPAIVVSVPILNSNLEGPSVGRLLMGRLVTEKFIERLSHQIQVDFSIVSSEKLQARKADLLKVEGEDKEICYASIDKQRSECWGELKDLNGVSMFVLRVYTDSKVLEKAEGVVWYNVFMFLIGGALVIAIIYKLLNVLVADRVEYMQRTVRDIRGSRDLSLRLNMEGRDELARLAAYFDDMVEEISEAEVELMQSREEAIKTQRHSENISRKLETANVELRESVARATLLANKAVEADEYKSQFLANMSHEIRTPLNSVVGFSQLLLDENLSDKAREFVEIILGSSDSLLELINDILDISKIEANQIVLEKKDVRLATELKHIRQMLLNQAMQKGVEIKVLNDLPEETVIKQDPLRLRQCLLNLANNSVKFTEKGHVHISAKVEKIESDEWLLLEVSDTGIGIAEDKQGKIFDMFTQADSSTTRKYGGTGLGLAITKRLVGLMGGEIKVHSKPGEGACFSIKIPFDEVACSEHEECHDPYSEIGKCTEESVLSGGRVLVAEDNLTSQFLMKQFIEGMGLELEIVDNGKDAVRCARANDYDAILMDMHMPEMNGNEAVEAIREAGVRTPIIAVTADAIAGDDQKCIDAGCDGYLSKPVSRSKLIEVLNSVLQSDSVGV